MKMDFELKEDQVIVTLGDNFSVEEAEQFRTEVNNLLMKGKYNLIVDFSNCHFIDSTGLGVLVSVFKKCVENNGAMKLYNLNDQKVKRVFQLTRLDRVFDISN